MRGLSMLTYREFNEEVYYATDNICHMNGKTIEFLKKKANGNTRKRARLCTHSNEKAIHHDMFIVHHHESYVPPHWHINKDESIHIIDGEALCLIYSRHGFLLNVYELNAYKKNAMFYLRFPKGIIHSLLIVSEWLVFHESTSGPFLSGHTELATWAPKESDKNAVIEYLSQTRKAANNHQRIDKQ